MANSIGSFLLQLFGIRTLTQNFIPVPDQPYLEADPAFFTITPDPANQRNILTGGGAFALTVAGSGAITVTTSMGVATVGSNATASPISSTIALRDGSGGVVGAYFATASTNVASTGALRAIAGNQALVAIKGATHTSVPIVSVAQGGVQVVLGDGTEISSVSFANSTLDSVNVISFGPINSFSIGQVQQTETGANAGNDATIQAQQGQNVASGTNNNGGDLQLLGGAAGTGGSGGSSGNILLQAALIELGSPTQADSYVDFFPISAPTSPGTNTSRLYSDSGNSGHLSSKSSGGTVTDLIAAAALATAAVPNTRTVTATGPLTGGGALSANISIGIQASSGSQAGSMSATQATQLATAAAAGVRVFHWGANASTTAAAAQNVPPGSQTVTISDTVMGIQTGPGGGTLTALYLQFTGSISNIAGQTVTFTLIKVSTGGASVTMATSSAMATTTGVQRQTVTSFTAATYSAGDVLTLILTPSALLTAVLTDVMGGAG